MFRKSMLLLVLLCALAFPACSASPPPESPQALVEAVPLGPTGLPVRYDARTAVQLTPVKNQGGTGGCWAFASIAALESYARTHERIDLDLSESNLMTQLSEAYDESFARGLADGGDDLMSVGYYVGWRGPVLESEDPFPVSAREEDMRVRAGLKPALYVQEVLFLPERKDPMDNDHIKRAVMEHGAVSVAMWKGSRETFGPYYNEKTFAWYCDKSKPNSEGQGHAVTIVGWDDNFPKGNFKIKPPGDGAFIVRNTKGPEWGRPNRKNSNGGYFYVSYYDLMFMTKLDSLVGNHVFSRVSWTKPYQRIYQHDLLGYNFNLNVQSDTGTASFANVFQTASPYGESVKAAGFYALEEGTEYEVKVVPEFTGVQSLNQGVTVATGKFDLPGYYTVDFDSPVKVKPGSRFAVLVTTKTQSNVPIAADSMDGLMVKRSFASSGESYVLLRSKWTDVTSVRANTNVCLKAFTDDEPPPASEMFTAEQMKQGIDFLVGHIKTHHAVAKRSGFTAEQLAVIDAARANTLTPLEKTEYYFQLQRIFVAMGDGHTVLHNPFQESRYLNLPFVWLMDDGIIATADTPVFRRGDRVLSIGGAEPPELIELLSQVVSHENEYWVRYNAPFYLTRASYLSHLGLLSPDGTVSVHVHRDGKDVVYRVPLTATRTLVPSPRVDAEWRIEKANNLGYFRFDRFLYKDEMELLEKEIPAFFAAVKENNIQNIAFDWRFNEGGTSGALNLILSYLKTGPVYLDGHQPYVNIQKVPESQQYAGTTYVLTSNSTYSCAVLASMLLHDNGIAKTLGEPTGENPAFNRHGTGGDGAIPITGWRFMMSTHEPGRPNFLDASEIALFPNIPVHTTRSDLLAGRDIQLERLREITAGTGWRYPSAAIDIPKEAKSLPIEIGAHDTFDGSRNTVVLASGPSAVTSVRFVETGDPDRVHPAELKDGKVILPATLEAGGTYHLVFETRDGVVAFLATRLGEQANSLGEFSRYFVSLSYVQRWNYFLIDFVEPVKSVKTTKISVVDSDGKPMRIESISYGHHLQPTAITVRTKRPVTKSDSCVITIGAKAVTLSSGVTNEEEMTLSNYKYHAYNP
ncbi:MAG: lectin like domain-containing protein [Bacillota bacterium]